MSWFRALAERAWQLAADRLLEHDVDPAEAVAELEGYDDPDIDLTADE